MSTEGEKAKGNLPKEKEKKIPGKPSVDFPVKVKATKEDPYHEEGVEFEVGTKKAKELEKRGWVKITGKLKEAEE